MSVTSGFFNSLNGDRRYNAKQMSAIFDGIINDGVFASIGTAFTVSADKGLSVNVGVGRAWFNSAWVYNDTLLPLTLEASEVVLNRIDAIVIEIDHRESVRLGDIKIVKGTPGSSPSRPVMTNNAYTHQYPLAYIYRAASSTEITQANITSMIGTNSCPYITGILQVQSIDNIVAQWNAQWDEWFAAKVAKSETNMSEADAEWNEWYANKTGEVDSDTADWMTQMKADFDIWFAQLQAELEADVSANMAEQILNLQEKFDTLARERCVYDGLEDHNGLEITDSYGTVVEGKTTLFGSVDGDSKSENENLTLYANIDTNWSGDSMPYVKTVSVPGIIAADEPFVDVMLSDEHNTAMAELKAFGCIYRIVTSDNQVIIYSNKKLATPMLLRFNVTR